MVRPKRKHDRIIHYEAAIQRMRFLSLFDVYNFMADIVGFAEDNDGHICIEEIMSLYRACPSVVEVSYDYDNSEKWGLHIDNLQHVGVYKAPKETRFTQKSDRGSMNVEFDKEDKYYYLVIRGVESMEEIKK